MRIAKMISNRSEPRELLALREKSRSRPTPRSAGSAVPREAISNILESAVFEQFTRDRIAAGEGQRNGSAAAAPSNVRPVNSTGQPGEALAVDGEMQATSVIPRWKRLFDCSAIILTSPFWLPVMLLIMLGIKFSSTGTVFYRQERIGFGGRRFMIFKFRTMKVNVETRVHESHFERLIEANVPMTKLDANGDPRLISCGRFLRAAGLDELPQLFNVLRGEMSLVGPRPCTVHEFQRYLPYQRARVNAPPGLTGYWQVNGKNRTTFSEMIEMDIYYGTHMSLALDLRILCQTLPAIVNEVMESRGIYPQKLSRPAVSNTAQAIRSL